MKIFSYLGIPQARFFSLFPSKTRFPSVCSFVGNSDRILAARRGPHAGFVQQTRRSLESKQGTPAHSFRSSRPWSRAAAVPNA